MRLLVGFVLLFCCAIAAHSVLASSSVTCDTAFEATLITTLGQHMGSARCNVSLHIEPENSFICAVTAHFDCVSLATGEQFESKDVEPRASESTCQCAIPDNKLRVSFVQTAGNYPLPPFDTILGAANATALDQVVSVTGAMLYVGVDLRVDGYSTCALDQCSVIRQSISSSSYAQYILSSGRLVKLHFRSR
jgi:hypothetical protein